MAKKPAPKTVSVGEPEKLTHSPFAGLSVGRPPDPQPTPSEPAVAVESGAAPAARSGRLVLARETKHRGGKSVVVVRGFGQLPSWDGPAVEQLAKELKRALGCGGTVESEREIVVQSDRPAQVAEWLRSQGFRVDGVTS